MINLAIHNKVILRVPGFSYQDLLVEHWDELKELIKESSSEFYEIIRGLSFEALCNAEEKTKLTVWKYYNRACFRSTPYGTFASVSLMKLNTDSTGPIIVAPPVQHNFPDWDQQNDKASFQISDRQVKLFANTMVYQVQDEMRYIQFEDGNFNIAVVDNDPIISRIIEMCSAPISYFDLIQSFEETEEKEVIQEYVTDMMELQLLFTDKHRNIIGDDFFGRNSIPLKEDRINYTISERKVIAGTVDKHVLRNLPRLVNLLHLLQDTDQPEDLSSFKNAFQRKYEEDQVPIMEALDPEIGIGYGRFSQPVDAIPLTKFINGSNDTVYTDKNSVLREKLFKEIQAAVTCGRVINLEDLVTASDTLYPLPNSLSVICSVVDETVMLESIGGATAVALHGRFALAIPEIEAFCKSLVLAEHIANPDVLFFDIGYTKEARIDNINRRPAIYELQLNLLNYDLSAEPLSTSDILVSCYNNEVILFSKRLDKRLIPRLATAYNYVRSDLPLFRFLMDVQNQNLQTGLMIHPMSLVPGLKHYPRIGFKNVIVSPARWLLRKQDLPSKEDDKNGAERLMYYLKSLIPFRYFRVGKYDQTLSLDKQSIQDVTLLHHLLNRDHELYIEEYCLPQRPSQFDQNGKPYLSQLVLTLTHHQRIYSAYNPYGENAKQWVAPGKEWIYFQLFCDPHRANALLQQKIVPYLKSRRSMVDRWFFIRYNEEGHHLRLRIKLKRRYDGYTIISEVADLFNVELQSGILADISIRTYKKEINRYSEELIEEVEEHFCKDSLLVSHLLSLDLTDNQKYRLCVRLIDHVMQSGFIEARIFQHYSKKVVDTLSHEYGLDGKGYKEINRMYKIFRSDGIPMLSKETATMFRGFEKSLLLLLEKSPDQRRPLLFLDMIHMHINRLFPIHQRLHELVCYNFHLLNLKRNKHYINPDVNAQTRDYSGFRRA